MFSAKLRYFDWIGYNSNSQLGNFAMFKAIFFSPKTLLISAYGIYGLIIIKF